MSSTFRGRCGAAIVLGATVASVASAGAGRWTPLGPYVASVGQVEADLGSPGVYAIAFSLLFRSVDGAARWQDVSPAHGTDSDAVQAFALDPNRPGRLYTGRSFGLERSDDGGLSWQFFGLGPAYEIAVAPSEPGTLYWGGTETLYRSDDAGEHGAALSGPWSRDAPITALAVDPHSSRTLYVGVSGAGIFRTTDGGAHWYPFGAASPTEVSRILVDARNYAFYALTWDGTLYTLAGNRTVWVPTGPVGKSVRSFALDPSDSSRLLAGADGVYESRDGGRSWLRRRIGADVVAEEIAVTALAVSPVDGAIHAGTEADGMFVSTDGGSTWSGRNDGLPPLSLASFFVGPSAEGRLYASGNQRTYRYDPATGWRVVLAAPAYDLASDASGETVFASVARCVELYPYTGFQCTGALYRSRDAGETWTSIREDGAFFAVAIDPFDANTVYASMSPGGGAFPNVPGVVLKSVDGGDIWTTVGIRVGPTVAFCPLRIVADPVVPERVFATDGVGIYRSLDAGASWEASVLNFGFSSPRIFDLAVGRQEGSPVYAGTDGGVYRSDDGGEAFLLPFVEMTVNAIVVEPADAHSVEIGALGVFRSTDGGEDFDPLGTNIGTTRIMGLAWDPTGTVLYAGTEGGILEFERRQTHTVPPRPIGVPE